MSSVTDGAELRVLGRCPRLALKHQDRDEGDTTQPMNRERHGSPLFKCRRRSLPSAVKQERSTADGDGGQ